MNIIEILMLKEAFYSCKIEGINKDKTFSEFLEEQILLQYKLKEKAAKEARKKAKEVEKV